MRLDYVFPIKRYIGYDIGQNCSAQQIYKRYR